MTTKLFLVIGVLQALALSQIAQADEPKCFDWPVTDRSAQVGQRFHATRPEYRRGRRKLGLSGPHDGLDIIVPASTILYAVADGVVVMAGPDEFGANVILVRTSFGPAYLFGHLSSMTRKAGDQVHRGDILGFSGGVPGAYGSGPYTTGAHLHFGAFDSAGRDIDPVPLFCRDAKR